MGLSDLLWACPACGKMGGIASNGACRCGAAFRRRQGSTIQARMPDGRVVDRAPADWVDRLPDPATLLEQRSGEDGPLRRAKITARESTTSTPLRSGDRYLNQVEVYDPGRPAAIELHPDRLVYRPEDENAQEWPLQHVTAVQTSSSTLQLRVRGQPLVSIRFHDDSLFLWETLLHAALRSFYRRTGRGEIAEFQPRIVTRP